MALFFALLNLLFGSFNDLVFKLYARKTRSRGCYVLATGAVWTLIFICCLKFDFSNLAQSIFWGAAAGVLSCVSNLLLIEAMAREEAGVCSTIFRLNMALSAVMAFALLGEQLTVFKLLAIFLALLAIFFFFKATKRKKIQSKAQYFGVFLAALASLMRSGMAICYKVAFSSGAERNMVITVTAVCWIIGGSCYFLLRDRRISALFERKSWGYGSLSALLIAGIIMSMALALEYGEVSLVAPVSQMSFLGTALLGVIFLGESISRYKLYGLICGVTCILLFALT